jgi:ATP-binding cassette subfamily C protein
MIALQTEASLAGGSYVTISKFLRLSLQSLALGVGAWLAIDDKISAGAIFAASFLAGRALQPVDQLLASWPVVTRARSAYIKLNEMLSAREAEIMLTQLPDPKGRIEAEGVWVAEPNGQGAILQNISFRVEPGEVVAVAGPSGAGKSTLLRVLAGAARADRGIVRIDGAKQADWDPERLGGFIGFLPQDTSLLAGTVKENIARFQYGPGVDADAIAAAQAANAHDMILKLQGGYETFLGWGGKGLSAGQAQRIGIARALYRNPPIVLLDEPNAHLDAAGEAQLVQTLNELKARGAAVIVVAHRAGILAAVDKILVLRDGRIEAYGPRDEVMAKLTGKESAGNITAKKAAS